MESAVSIAPRRPTDFVSFTGQGGRGKACFWRGGAACFSAGRGGASIPDEQHHLEAAFIICGAI